jgi:tetratricopeptide (TPR) repeat protein
MITPEEFDERFAAHIESEFGEVLRALPAWVSAQERLMQYAEAADWANAREAAEEAIRLMPGYVDAGSAYLYLARAQSEQDDDDAARRTLARYFDLGGYSPDALLQLGRWLTEAGETDAAIAVYDSLVMVAPLDQVGARGRTRRRAPRARRRPRRCAPARARTSPGRRRPRGARGRPRRCSRGAKSS